MIAGIIVIAVVVILLLACVGGYNTLVKPFLPWMYILKRDLI